MIDKSKAPLVVEIYADNGEHSHFKLIDVETGETLWEEPEEGNVPEANACAQLAEVRARIECMMLITDCKLDDTEQRRINRSFSDGYNKAIRDTLNMMSEHFG